MCINLIDLKSLGWFAQMISLCGNLRTDTSPRSSDWKTSSDEMLPTPPTSHVDISHIYEPAEDSFLLLDTLSSSSEIAFLKQRLRESSSSGHNPRITSPAPLVLEVGPGSGVVLAFATAHANAIFGRADILALGIDINKFACDATGETVSQACKENSAQGRKTGVYLDTLNGDLGTAIRSGAVDVLVFNPPYVPTSPLPQSPGLDFDKVLDSSGTTYEEDSYLLSLSYAGGIDGMEITNKLLKQIPSLLNAHRGVAYILLCNQNKPQDVMRYIQSWKSNWSVEIVRQSGKTGGREKLQVIKIWRTWSLLDLWMKGALPWTYFLSMAILICVSQAHIPYLKVNSLWLETIRAV